MNTKIKIDVFTEFASSISIGKVSLPSGSPSNGQLLIYNSALNQWQYQTVNVSGLVDLTTNQTVGGIKTFTSVINANGGIHLPASTNIAINTPNTGGNPEIDILQNALDVPLALTYGVRIRRPDNLAFAQFAWDANGFSLYRVDAGVPALIFTVANGRLTMLQDPSAAQDIATKNYVDTSKYKGYAISTVANQATTGGISTYTNNNTWSKTFFPTNIITEPIHSGSIKLSNSVGDGTLFVAPVDGSYCIVISMQYQNAAPGTTGDGYLEFLDNINGSNVSNSNQSFSMRGKAVAGTDFSYPSITYTTIVTLAASDKYSMWLWSLGGGAWGAANLEMPLAGEYAIKIFQI